MSVGVVNKQTGDRIPTAGMPAIDNALDLTSVNPVQNAVITAALALKQNATDNSLQTTDKTVVGAINEHEGDIGSLMSGLTNNTRDLNTGSKTKNILPMTLSGIKAANTSGVWADNVYTINNGTITVNLDNDGNVSDIVIDGSFSANTLNFYLGEITAETDLILNGYTGSWSGGGLTLFAVEKGTTSPEYSTGSGGSVTLSLGKTYEVKFSIARSTKNNVRMTPMVRISGDGDYNFAPYIPSVDARLDAVESDLTKLTANKSGIHVNLKTYTSINMYTIPKDGYIVVNSDTDSTGNNRIVVRDSIDSSSVANIYQNVTGTYQIESLFVKAGLKVYVNTSTANSSIEYIPLSN